MALTLVAEQRLTKAGLVQLFTAHEAVWTKAAKSTVQYIVGNFPAGVKVRPDDIAQPLVAVLEVNEVLKSALSAKKLTERYWVRFFADLIIERTWEKIKS